MKNSERYLHSLLPFVDFLYILQLEDYNSRNYFVWIQDRLFKRGFQKVGHISWTTKARMLLTLSLLLYIILVIQISLLIPNLLWMLLILIIVSFCIPYIVLLANALLSFVDIMIKKSVVTKAAKKLAGLPDLKVVAIIGSQGKTSTRSFITQLVAEDKKWVTPPGNHNVPLAIARDIIKNVHQDTEIYVVELGEFYRGALSEMIMMLKPWVIVLTSITSQHIAQFGSQSTIDQEFIGAINAANASTILINGQDDGVKRIKPVLKVEAHQFYTYELDGLHQTQTLPEVLHIPHMQSNAAAAVAVARRLNISTDHIKTRLAELTPVEQRLNIMHRNGITIIDDSYNISPESASKALRHLDTHPGRHIIVTGGIVDQGLNAARANEAFGEQLGHVADVVVLASNHLAPHVKKGIISKSDKVQIIESTHPTKTPEILARTLIKGDVVLIQNELPDLYWS